jgi:hypothetical protein
VPYLTKLVSFWAAVGFAMLMALQVVPYTGVFLMIFGGMVIAGALIHLFLISLFFEALFGRVPRVLMIVPIAAYGAYYAVYLYQGSEIQRTSAALQASNPGKVLDFDPSLHSLVTAQANALVQGYAIPVAYEANRDFQPEAHLSFRLIRRDQCDIPRDSQGRIQTFGMHFGRRFQRSVCVLRFPEAPTSDVVLANRHGDDEVWRRKWRISQQVTEIVVDGAVVGSYRTASVWRLSPWPIVFVGCALISSTSAWKCGADFMRSHIVLDTLPAGVDRESYDSPISVMLGLKKYTASDLADFRGYALNDEALARVAVEPGRVEDSVFAVLAAIVDGQNPRPTFNMGYSLAQNPARLAPLAEKLAARLVELNQSDARRTPNHDDQVRALATALASLPRAAFLRIAGQLYGVIEQPSSWSRYPTLYLRAGDMGMKAFAVYKRDFMTGKAPAHLRMLPVLAICRIGQADDETVGEMKRRLLASEGNQRRNDDDYKSALFVALMKLGEERFLRENITQLPARLHQWADAVLEGTGATETGPNNCMAMRWGSTAYLASMLEPGLHLMRGVWSSRDRTN